MRRVDRLFRDRADKGRPVNPLSDEKYSLDDLKEALKAQKTELKPGSILLGAPGKELSMTARERMLKERCAKLGSRG